MHRLCDLCWSITGERVGSLAARHAVPPDCYAGILCSNAHAVSESVHMLLRHANNVFWLDKLRHTDARAMELWRDVSALTNKVIRSIFAFFGRDGVDSPAGKRLLRGCIQTLADNKGVEELHHSCKLDVKHNACKKQTPTHLQHVVLNSQVLEHHGLNHAAAITRQTFRRQRQSIHR